MKIPDGYEKAVDPEAESESLAAPTFVVPDGYSRPKKPAMLQGRERLCHSCYDKGIQIVDTVCPACIESLKQLGRLRVEIGRTYPKALELSLPALMRGLFKALVKERQSSAPKVPG